MVLMGDERFPKSLRLLSRREFILANRYGKRLTSRSLILLVRMDKWNADRPQKLGITASRKVGKAHDRNRIKRWCREFFRRNKERFRTGHDYVVIIKSNHEIEKFADLEAEFDQLLDTARAGTSKKPSH